MVDILCIPDSHAKPGVSNNRFTLAGKFIMDRRPDIIVNIGDFADMESLCSYDKGKRSFEGRRYKKDIEAANDALDKLMAPIVEYNKQQARNNKKRYKPRLVFLTGNHCQRINRVTELQPEMDGTISINDIKFDKYGWEVHPFLEVVNIEGVHFSHYFTTGVMGKAVSGETPALKLIRTQMSSCVQGHIHTRDFAERVDADGRRVQGLVVGCYLEKDQYEAYAGAANKLWWKGLVMLNNVKNGSFDHEFISIDTLEEKYNA